MKKEENMIPFSSYQKGIIALLAIVQFTIILDFMVMAPLGATFLCGTVLAMIMVVIYTNLKPIPLWQLIAINTLMFAGIMSRMIPSSALMTVMPKPEDRGAFMSVNASLQQVAGGVASVLAGLIIVQETGGRLRHFDTLGYVALSIMVLCAVFMYFINQQAIRRSREVRRSENERVHENVQTESLAKGIE